MGRVDLFMVPYQKHQLGLHTIKHLFIRLLWMPVLPIVSSALTANGSRHSSYMYSTLPP